MRNIYPETPVGKLNEIKVNYPPAKVALASYHDENTSVSSVIALTHDTTEIEVSATGAPVAGKWAVNQATSVVTAAGSANFDFIVPAASVRRFAVPIRTNVANEGSIQGVNRTYGLYQNVAFKSAAGAGSVLAMEF